MPEITTVILAAGKSSRMGAPKQLLFIEGMSLISRAVQCALTSKLGPVIVVLGAHVQPIKEEMQGFNVTLVINDVWEAGMHTSIRCGIDAVEIQTPNSEAVILMNCDQPLVTPNTLRSLASEFEAFNPPAVASRYGSTIGSPALFSRNLFEQLKSLKEGGAKTVLKEVGSDIRVCDFTGGEVDLDTPEEYSTFLQSCATIE